MHENICYKKPFLKEVIFKIDFPSPIEGLGKNLPQNISKIALKNFPISEPQKVQSQEFQISNANIQAKRSEETQWVFHGKNRLKHLIISPNSIVFSFKKYKSYEHFTDQTTDFISEFYKKYKDLSVSRIGVRYVNVIELDEDKPLVWNEYINEGMLGLIDFHGEQEHLTRSFHILEFNFDGQAVKYQFGIANPDYPAVIKRKHFVLDIDSYFNGAIEQSEIFDCVEKAHEKIQGLFEKSITDKTRTLMKQVQNNDD
ncbi:MAG: TIGR04255 family protein [Candidatus Electrothrix sp. AX5]|nr:TIGR04255 family protein [Candidatus Electrothrix sp. AX5]